MSSMPSYNDCLCELWANSRDWLDYNADTGLFIRTARRGKYMPGSAFGFIGTHGYVYLSFGQSKIRAHRLAWAAYYNEEPLQIDHINGISSDNRIANLRLATHIQNGANTRIKKNNKCGYKGVYAWNGRWRAMIRVNRKGIHIGMYDTAEKAHAAYVTKAIEVFGQFARSG